MTKAYEGRVAIVTGGGTGIGQALAAAFHREGARVAIASRDPGNLKKAAREIAGGGEGGSTGDRLLTVRVDVRVSESAAVAVGQVVEKWGRVDILINNAGVSGQNPIDAQGPEADPLWLDIIGTNLHGSYHMIRACLPHMTRGGRIINISSVLGKFGVAGYSAYCAAKHGVVGLTRALAAELAPRGITVNAICPGWVDTSMSRRGVDQIATRLGITPDEFKKAANERVPLGRFLEPAEVAPLALYIASGAADAMTGQAVNIEGGATTW